LGDEERAAQAMSVIHDAVTVLRRHPLIGREAEEGFRELVISVGKTGYVALYDYDARDDSVLVHAIEHQRELRATPGDD
jgi:plasmid stabilization system protein ParE